jgi:hypothetical protein
MKAFNSSNKTPALKQNIPLFHRKFPLGYKVSLKLGWFFPKITSSPYVLCSHILFPACGKQFQKLQ